MRSVIAQRLSPVPGSMRIRRVAACRFPALQAPLCKGSCLNRMVQAEGLFVVAKAFL